MGLILGLMGVYFGFKGKPFVNVYVIVTYLFFIVLNAFNLYNGYAQGLLVGDHAIGEILVRLSVQLAVATGLYVAGYAIFYWYFVKKSPKKNH